MSESHLRPSRTAPISHHGASLTGESQAPLAAADRANKPRILCVAGPRRIHKLLPLLDGFDVDLVSERDGAAALLRPRTRPDLVMLDTFGRWAALALAWSWLCRAPLVVRLRGEYFRERREILDADPGPLRRPRYAVNVALGRLCLSRARLVVTTSDYLGQAMRPWVPEAKSVVVHNPVTGPVTGPAADAADGRPPALPQGGLHLLSVTNMNLRSKVDPTIEAMDAWVPPDLWDALDIHWVVCGRGHHEARLRDWVAARDLSHRVHVAGHVEGLAPYYDWCHALVHLTRLDAFPNVTMEALTHARPVITNADSCGTREQVRDGESGFVVEDAAGFVQALGAYASSPALRARHAANGKRFVEDAFCVAAQRTRMKSALDALLATTGRTGRASVRMASPP